MVAANPFWDYSLLLYQRPGVAEFCLRLQDGIESSDGIEKNTAVESSADHSEYANVNILLFCCWLGNQGVRLADDDLIALKAAIEPWHKDNVLPLRVARRTPGITEQRKHALLERELAAERGEQDQLFAWFQAFRANHKECDSQVLDNIRHNLHCYAKATLAGKFATESTLIGDNAGILQVLFEVNPLQREAEKCASFQENC